ncbi:MAG: succinate dehydrogenase, hydrophobic membrane anchor protein [Gammaproteobacteria bacterium]
MSLVSPLNKVLGLGSAKGGSEHWWVQRLSAVALVPLGLWLVTALAALPGFDYASITVWMSGSLNSILLIVLILTMSYHSWLGVQVVVEDYVRGAAKTVTLMASTLAHLFLACAGVYSVLRIGFGA